MYQLLLLVFIIATYSNSLSLELEVLSRDPNEMIFQWNNNLENRNIFITTSKLDIDKVIPDSKKKYNFISNLEDVDNTSIIAPGQFVLYVGNLSRGSATINGFEPQGKYSIDLFVEDSTNTYNNIISKQIQMLAPKVHKQAFNINFVKTKSNSISLNFLFGQGFQRIVVARENLEPDLSLIHPTKYIANANFGKGDSVGVGTFVVADFMGNNVEITNLNPNTIYFFKVIEYNGDSITANYNISDAPGNPSGKRTLLPTPKILNAENTETKYLFKPKWEKVEGALSYILDVAYDHQFKRILDEYRSIDVGDLDHFMVKVPNMTDQVFYRVKAIAGKNFSEYSDADEVIFK